jgi:cysteinyl-tRNA synthetase
VKELFAKHTPETIRFFLLSTHYRSPIQFSDELLTDLALSCAMWLGMGRMLRTLDIGQSCRITL